MSHSQALPNCGMQRPMMNTRTIRRFTQKLGLFALLAALCLRAAVPTGYMLDRAENGDTITLRLCGGLDEHYVKLNLKTGEKQAADPEAPVQEPPETVATTTCPYALTAAFDLPLPAHLAQPHITGPPAPAVAIEQQATPSFASRPPLPARGPPSLA